MLWMKFRLVSTPDLVTPKDTRTYCSCKISGGEYSRLQMYKKGKSVQIWKGEQCFATVEMRKGERIVPEVREIESWRRIDGWERSIWGGRLSRQEKTWGKWKAGSVDGIKHSSGWQMPEGSHPLCWLCSLQGGNVPCSMSHMHRGIVHYHVSVVHMIWYNRELHSINLQKVWCMDFHMLWKYRAHLCTHQTETIHIAQAGLYNV